MDGIVRIDEIFRALAVSHSLFLAALLFRDHRADRSSKITAAFAAGVASYLVLPALVRANAPFWSLQSLFFLRAIIPFLFWHGASNPI